MQDYSDLERLTAGRGGRGCRLGGGGRRGAGRGVYRGELYLCLLFGACPGWRHGNDVVDLI
jgi:hypothetical protein